MSQPYRSQEFASSSVNSLNPPSTYALVIGNNDYKHPNFPKLRNAISDAKSFAQYLVDYLGVPEQHVLNLHNARRAEMIAALLRFRDDSSFPPGSAFIVYYAGHGGEGNAPGKWASPNGKIQLLIPSNYDGMAVPGIPDRTIGLILEGLAIAKGDNITVILDCCFSGSGTRGQSAGDSGMERGVEVIIPTPENLDEELFPVTRGTAKSPSLLCPGVRSHVLLAACKSYEKAREARESGVFTTALLEVLKKVRVDQITYTELMQRLPKLPNQTPQCEGVNRNRILFNNTILRSLPLHAITHNERGELQLSIGSSYGIAPGAQFAIFASRDHAMESPPVGYARALIIEPSTTTLDQTKNAMLEGEAPVALQLLFAGTEWALKIFVSHVDQGRFKSLLDEIQELLRKRDGVQRGITYVSRAEDAIWGLSFPHHGVYQARLDIHDQRITRDGLHAIPESISPAPKDLCYVLSSLALFDWHLHRESAGIGSGHIDVEFCKLREEDAPRDFVERGLQVGRRMYTPDGPNLLQDFPDGRKVVTVDVDKKNGYGITVYNKDKGRSPFYVSAFYFGYGDLSVDSYYEPATCLSSCASALEPSVLPGQELTIGYGASGGTPLIYHLDDNQSLDVGYIKLFLSTVPVDLSHIVQDTPFGHRKGGPKKVMPRSLWGSLGFWVVQRRGEGQ